MIGRWLGWEGLGHVATDRAPPSPPSRAAPRRCRGQVIEGEPDLDDETRTAAAFLPTISGGGATRSASPPPGATSSSSYHYGGGGGGSPMASPSGGGASAAAAFASSPTRSKSGSPAKMMATSRGGAARSHMSPNGQVRPTAAATACVGLCVRPGARAPCGVSLHMLWMPLELETFTSVVGQQ